ncbi:hypothetical protein DCC81_18145 [Chitinophaga parva]|uniref:Cold-shock protein n=1 Tax=Chitinophaga parva TaxID=2169414 RepID=A0A2T7BIQ9_9BACT|nr:hypothetical protein [Chitinophaga parva]PUZ26158.1 hypothetical protein DCC81_18145 [Chitinophaga parva]
MAKSQASFAKKQREKKKLQNQQAKKEKMQERKDHKEKGKSLEDMMAYLDENGNLTDTPVDVTKKVPEERNDS